MEVHRGEVFYADLSPVGGIGAGRYPARYLIIQNEIGNRHSPTVIAAAITSRQGQKPPAHPHQRARRPLRSEQGTASCSPSRSARWTNAACGNGAGRIPPDDMAPVDEALGVSMGLESQNIRSDGSNF